MHGAELIARKLLSPDTGTFLLEEHRSLAGQLDSYRTEQVYKREQSAQEQQREHNIKRSFHGTVKRQIERFFP